jgi:ADP-ribosyl-[dinitrogen reductase] hydrolase
VRSVARIDQDKALGAMLGLAVGDALGAPLDGLPHDQAGGIEPEMTGGGAHDLRPGQGTGVTQLALRLATTLAELGGYDADHALRGYVAWYRTDPPGMSDHMREVLGMVAGGNDSFRATSSFHFGGGVTSGNGAVMRATPLAIAFAGHDGALRDATLADAALTHFDPLAGKVALLHNQAISWLLVGGPQRLYDELKNPEWLDDRIEDVVYPATAGVRGFAETLAKSEPGSALASIAIGLVTVFNADSFEQAIRWAVGLGGDADANGAVAGALLGARFGAAGIPQRWLDALERRAEIEGLTERLVALAR